MGGPWLGMFVIRLTDDSPLVMALQMSVQMLPQMACYSCHGTSSHLARNRLLDIYKKTQFCSPCDGW